MSKPTDYLNTLDRIHLWIHSEDDSLPEGLEPEALAYLIRKLGEERDALMELVRLSYETRQCPRCKAILDDGEIHEEGCPLLKFQVMAITDGGRNQEVLNDAE